MRERRIMPPLCDWQIINQVFGIYYYIEPELQNMNLIAFKKPNVPWQLKPFPIYVELQEQLFEPWVLMQDAFGRQLFILRHEPHCIRQCLRENILSEERCNKHVTKQRSEEIMKSPFGFKDPELWSNLFPFDWYLKSFWWEPSTSQVIIVKYLTMEQSFISLSHETRKEKTFVKGYSSCPLKDKR